MSYLKVQYSAAVNGQSYFLIPKDNILYVIAGAGALTTTVDVFMRDQGFQAAGSDAYRITFDAAAATGFSLVDAVSDAWASNPGGIVAQVGGIPATVSATGQALTFCQVTGVTLV
tara:strand:- start:197 stop:541 length:345 start_codon:yes stop_codon:yes gene_type:complete